MMHNSVRVGVAGLGFGSRVHVPGLQSLPHVSVVAIAGTNKDRAQAVADKCGIGVGCGSLEDFFSQNLDAVTLALPPKQNEIAARMALERGLPVLAEKPLASSAGAAQQLAELAKGKGAMVDFHFAELAPFQKLKELIETRKYGAVRHVQIAWLVESLAQMNKKWSWKTDMEQCGGVNSMLGSHLFYLIEWLLGSIQKMSATMSSSATAAFAPPGSHPAEDGLFLLLDLPDGVKLAATISNASPCGIGHRWEVAFDGGTAILHNPRLDYMTNFTLTMRTQKGEEILSTNEPLSSEDNRSPFHILAQRFIDAVRSHSLVSPDFAAGARVQSLMEASYISNKQGKTIEV
ncbi:MAG: Gfo/Idh/MocA family oxidoreductase [Patescibacteria group bacterium]